MNLTIDMGNTQTKVGFFEGDELVHHTIYPGLSMEHIISFFQVRNIENTILSSVIEHDASYQKYLTQHSNFLLFDENTPLPVVNDYETPHTLGNDRLAAVVGAYALYPGKDVLIIDAGTCITYDVLRKDGHYLGGNITPGINIRLKALNNYTGRLPLLEKEPVDYLIGSSTKKAILSGVIQGIFAELNGMIENYRQQFPGIMVVLTGGDANFFDTNLKSEIFASPNLVLLGLNKTIQFNAERQ